MARSATGVVLLQAKSAFFFTGRLSPVKADSSTDRSLLSRRRPSATILSPVSAMMMSPTTMSFWVTNWASPFRSTLIKVSSLIRFSASKAFALFPSVMMVITTDREMAAKMPTHSRKLYSPPVKYRVMFTARVMTAAKISISSIGSVEASQIRRARDSWLWAAKELAPYFARDASAWLSLRPFSRSVPVFASSSSRDSIKASFISSLLFS